MNAPNILGTISSELGWMALIGSGDVLLQLKFGHRCQQAAIEALDPELLAHAEPGRFAEDLVERLKAYAAGEPVDFRDVRVDPGPSTDFRSRVLRHCRRIRYGETITYGQLAAKAGFPRAARAVGSCMAANRLPLIIPCHRVIAAGGRTGGFSAVGGIRTKKRLLALEAV
ncbi:hypothetical protein LCGC14_2184870 [marine sediment metagenome]|uniref:methylated-DNA--[protein]-cysteine S-methyltransferase n=1 Tax=marine sediment metagenome TaxID=412755 RepID=A0A0F9DL55_9ZZZZ